MKRVLHYKSTDDGYGCFENDKLAFEIKKADLQLCAQPRVCSLTGGSPVYPRPNQPDISESWDGISNDA